MTGRRLAAGPESPCAPTCNSTGAPYPVIPWERSDEESTMHGYKPRPLVMRHSAFPHFHRPYMASAWP